MKEWKKRVLFCPKGCGMSTETRPVTDEEWEEERDFLGTRRESTTFSKCKKCGFESIGGYE